MNESRDDLERDAISSIIEQISGIKELINSPYWDLLSRQIKENWMMQLKELKMQLIAINRLN